MQSRYFLKYLSTVPVVATLAVVTLFIVFTVLNYMFPGLQYGTFFHSLPK